MGIFNIFRKDRNNAFDDQNPSKPQPHEIPAGLTDDKDNDISNKSPESNGSAIQNGINLLYQYLDKNYEKKGYDDALINADNIHLEQNIAALRNDLERTIRKVKTFYEDFIREIDFHISSRTRSGMIDTVEELKVKKETAENHIRQVLEIEQEAKNNKGPGEGIIISDTRGFRNGLAAITHHSIMNRNF
jgi:hypothetical protein